VPGSCIYEYFAQEQGSPVIPPSMGSITQAVKSSDSEDGDDGDSNSIQFLVSYMPNKQPQGHSEKLHGVNALIALETRMRIQTAATGQFRKKRGGGKKCYFCVTQHKVA
jgi:hypothetical protein